MVLVVISSAKVISRSTSFNPLFIGLAAGWISFQAQSIISINQIGLGIWGWVLSGAIIGYEINTRSEAEKQLEAKKVIIKGRRAQSSPNSVIAMFIAFFLGVSVGIPPYLASARYKGALENGNQKEIVAAAYIWPVDFTRMIQVAATLDQYKFNDQALGIAEDATKRFPDNYEVWANLNSMSNATTDQKVKAQKQMKRLDPFNPNLK
jgi:hypothetical protein